MSQMGFLFSLNHIRHLGKNPPFVVGGRADFILGYAQLVWSLHIPSVEISGQSPTAGPAGGWNADRVSSALL